MASIFETIQENYKTWGKGISPDVDSWFLMDSPKTPISILLVYLLFVLKIGPDFMQNRKGWKLRNVLIAYNGIQVVFSAIIVWMSLRVEIPLNALFSPYCSQKYPSFSRTRMLLLDASWWYIFAKVTELLDTVFFVLRKKQSQVSFLHVYHHTVMVLYTWLLLKYSNVNAIIIIGLNSFVHVIMYTYYMIAAMGPKYQKYIWWKKYMTVMQLAQFCIIISSLIMTSFSKCGQSKAITYFLLTNTIIFLYLFTDFYRKSYTSKQKTAVNGKSKTNEENNNTKYADSKIFIADNKTRITKGVENIMMNINANEAEKYRKIE